MSTNVLERLRCKRLMSTTVLDLQSLLPYFSYFYTLRLNLFFYLRYVTYEIFILFTLRHLITLN